MLQSGFLLNARFRIHHHLSQGGFGITYIAWDTMNQKNVCIKEAFNPQYHIRLPDGRVQLKESSSIGNKSPNHNQSEEDTLKTSLIEEIEFVENQFKEEAEILKNQKSQYVPDSEGVLETNGTLYLILEFVEGPTLAKFIEQNGVMSADLIRSVFSKLAHALDQLHHRNILHGDIAPDNIILNNLDRPVLIDFGSAQIFHGLGQPYEGLETQKILPIKKHYSPPEFFLSAPSLKSDIYSLGATMFYAATGEKPRDARMRTVDTPLPGLERVTDEGIREIIQTTTSLDPKRRFERMRTFGERLIPNEPDESETQTPKPWMAIGGILVVIGLAIGSVAYFSDSKAHSISAAQAKNLAEAFFLNLEQGQPESFMASSVTISLRDTAGTFQQDQLKSIVGEALDGIAHMSIESWKAEGTDVLNVEYKRKIQSVDGQQIIQDGILQFRHNKITFWEEL